MNRDARSRGDAQPRRVAYDILLDVIERDAYANLALNARVRGMSARDAAFVTELVAGTLRMQGRYDAILNLVATRGVPHVPTRIVLRLGIHQLLSMRTPAHAAISETVELAKRVAGHKTTGFVNAVLRTVSREPNWEKRLRAAASTRDQWRAEWHSHPEWMVRALRQALAADRRLEDPERELDALLAADNTNPKVQLALLGSEDLEDDTVAALCPELSRRGPSPLGWELKGGSPEAVTAQLDGFCHPRVQDQGSQLAALALLAASPLTEGERWLDLCAGPGGKTALLAVAAKRHGATLRANEVSPHRAELVVRALSEAGVDPHTKASGVTVSTADGCSEQAFAEDIYDRVLVDAPCTGLGALRRRPEARWRKQPSDVAQLTRLQDELLAAAIAHTRPGGTVAYVTCSPHIAETALVVERALAGGNVRARNTWEVLEGVVRRPLDRPASSPQPWAQLWPHRDNTDAMFIALLERV